MLNVANTASGGVAARTAVKKNVFIRYPW